MKKIIFLLPMMMAWGQSTVRDQTVLGFHKVYGRVDYTLSEGTRPVQIGTTLPSTCFLGQLFIKVNDPADSVVKVCTAEPGTWTAPGGQGGGGTGDLTDVIAGTGISVTNSAGPQPTVSLNINNGSVQTCSAGQHVSAVSASGIVTCSADTVGTGDVTDVTAGTGISVASSTGPQPQVSLNINAGSTQTCSAGQHVSAVSSTGIVTCSADTVGTGDLTDVLAGTGIAVTNGTGPQPSVALNLNGGSAQTCSAGQHVSAVSAIGVVTCSADTGGGGSTTSFDAPALTISAGDTYFNFMKSLNGGTLADQEITIQVDGTHTNNWNGTIRLILCTNNASTAACDGSMVARCHPSGLGWDSFTSTWSARFNLIVNGSGASTPLFGSGYWTTRGNGLTGCSIQAPSDGPPTINTAVPLYAAIQSYSGGTAGTLTLSTFRVVATPK